MLPGSVREISGYGVLRNRLPQFEQLDDYLWNNGVISTKAVSFHAHDVFPIYSGVIRVANIAYSSSGVPELHLKYISDMSQISEDASTFLSPTGDLCFPLSGVAINGTQMFWHDANGNVTSRVYTDGAAQNEVLFNQLSDVGMAAVSEAELYVNYALSETTRTIRLFNRTTGSFTHTFDGAVYGEHMAGMPFDAVRIGDTDYIVYQSGNNARIIKRIGDVWSESNLVFPLDVVDDTFSFTLGSASAINNRLVIVGLLRRNKSQMKIYTIGPEHFSLGREMFIAEGHNKSFILAPNLEAVVDQGKMVLKDDMLYVFGGDGCIHRAKSTILFGSDREDQKITIPIEKVSYDSQSNRPARGVFDIPPSVTTPLLKSGSILDWYASINNVEARMGRFQIDVVMDAKETHGTTTSIIARSLSLKNLSSWNSDSSLDYWSQTKQSVSASNMEEIVRGSGAKYVENGDVLSVSDLNKEGIVYTILKATRNGTAVGEFKIDPSAEYIGRYGVAIAYYRETPQDAAARMGTNFASNGDTVSHGLFFVVEPTKSEMQLYRVVDGFWNLLATVSAVIPNPDNWHWLRIDFREGNVRCYYRNGPVWVKVIDQRLITDESRPYPWFRDEIGRAAIYMENITIRTNSYNFEADSNVVPVESNEDFPMSGYVQVDDEVIQYSGKSPNRSRGTLSDPIAWVSGTTHKDAPHNNPYQMPDQHLVEIGGDPKYTACIRDANAHGVTFKATDNWEVGSVDLYMKSKYNDSRAVWVKVALATAASYYDYFPKESTYLATCKRRFFLSQNDPAFGQLAGEGDFRGEGWVRFNLKAELKAGRTYVVWLLDKWGNITTPSATYNYYLSDKTDDSYWMKFSGGVDYGSWRKTKAKNMLLRVNGHSGSSPGHEIYLAQSDVQRPVEYYNNCALVCVSGKGAGKALRILGYDYHAPHQLVDGQWVDKNYSRVFVQEYPENTFDDSSKFIITPALVIVSRGDKVEIMEGKGNVAVAHYNSHASLYPEGFRPEDFTSGIFARTFEYYSGDEDMKLSWMISEIAGKANVLDVSEEKHFSGALVEKTFSEILAEASERETAIIDFSVSDWQSGGVGMIVFDTDRFLPSKDRPLGDYAMSVIVFQNRIECRSYETEEMSNYTLLEMFSFPHNIQGDVTISFQKTSFAVWNNGQYLTHFSWRESEAEESTFDSQFLISPICTGIGSATADWSELDVRVDNFILDIGQSGLSLINGLIGEKRVFFLDDSEGNLRLFRNRVEVNPTAPLAMQVNQSTSKTDTDVKTRLRAEGIEIVELVDYNALAEYGNLFEMVGLREPNNITEENRELELILSDKLKSEFTDSLDGVADPRLEPEDLFLVTIDGEHKFVVVESLSYLMIGGMEPVFDMNVEGFEWGPGSVRSPQFTLTQNIFDLTAERPCSISIGVDASPDAVISVD